MLAGVPYRRHWVRMEPLRKADRDNYAAFIVALADALLSANMDTDYPGEKPIVPRPLLTAALEGRHSDLFASLAPHFDQLNIMTYESIPSPSRSSPSSRPTAQCSSSFGQVGSSHQMGKKRGSEAEVDEKTGDVLDGGDEGSRCRRGISAKPAHQPWNPETNHRSQRACKSHGKEDHKAYHHLSLPYPSNEACS